VPDVITFVKQIFMEAIPLRLLLNKIRPSLGAKLVDIKIKLFTSELVVTEYLQMFYSLPQWGGFIQNLSV
jgi:hypothetical protein